MAPLSSSSQPTRAIGILAALGFCCALPTAGAEPAIGQFELKTLDSSAGAFEFQSQNAWSGGNPDRRVARNEDGELVFDENAVVRQRHAIELEAGLTSALKMRVGVEFEKERLDDVETPDQANAFDELNLTEFGIELIAVLVPRPDDGAGFGVVVEFEQPRDREESGTLIIGPVIEFRSGRWFAAAVPTVVRTLGGRTDEGAKIDDKWDFAYAAQLAYSVSDRWSLALESYGTVERLSDSGHPSEAARLFGDFDQHRAGPVVYRAFGFGGSQREQPASSTEDDKNLSLGVGLLAGLNHHTPDYTLKLSLEIDF